MNKFYNEISKLIENISDKANIKSININVDMSILVYLDLHVFNTKRQFMGRGINRNNIFTQGTMLKRAKKLFDLINSCEYIEDYNIELRRIKKQKHLDYRYIKIDPNKEHFYFDYAIVVNFIGMTPAGRKKIEDRQCEEARLIEKRKAMQDHINFYSELNKNKIYDCLGYANGWTVEPQIVKTADSDVDCYYETEKIGRCLTKYICHKYKFYYIVDSSD